MMEAELPGKSRQSATVHARKARTRARILAAAFEVFGAEQGLYCRIEDIAARAAVTRQTVYNHFTGMEELREALSHEVTHDFLRQVTSIIETLADPREHASVAIRLYLERARRDPRWAWSMINISGSGIIFGSETYERAARTIAQGIEGGVMQMRYASIGRDLVLGTALAALFTMLKEKPGDDYPSLIARHILVALGVAPDVAQEIASRPLPKAPANTH